MLLLTMPPKKGLKGMKGTRKAKVKKTVQLMSDSDDSESLLGPERPSQRPVSEHKEGEEGEDASNRPAPEATQEEADLDEDDGAPAKEEGPCLRWPQRSPGAGPGRPFLQ